MCRPWMPLYVGDYLADTGHLTTLEHGAYMLLIMHYWRNGGLPDCDDKLSRIARLPLEQWQSIRGTVQDLFYDGWKHKRIDVEIATAEEKYEKRANAGKKGGEAKANNKQCSSNAEAMPYHLQSQPQLEDKKDIRAVANATRSARDEQFEAFRKAYPRRKGANPSKPARAAWDVALRAGASPDQILSALKAGVGFDSDKIGTEYIPRMSTWLRDRRYEDHVPLPDNVVPIGFYAAAESDELVAWDAHSRATKRENMPRDKNGGWYVPTRWPPGYQTAAG